MIMDDDERGAVGGMLGSENRSTQRKPAPIAPLSTTNPIVSDMGSKQGRRGGKPETYRLNCGTAKGCLLISTSICVRVDSVFSSFLVLQASKMKHARMYGAFRSIHRLS
jgi:hypothetical protein